MLRSWIAQSSPLPGAPRVLRLAAAPDNWLPMARDIAASGARLMALWVDREPAGSAVWAAFLTDSAVLAVQLNLPTDEQSYPGLAELFPCASRMQRAAADLTGIVARDPDSRPWLRHAAWPAEYFPLAPQSEEYRPSGTPDADRYPFVRVSGDGVHEIPVGPVHAGIIEPGHFRFSIVGEKVLRLEEHLGYVHKGIERLFSRTQLLAGHRLAALSAG